MIIYLSGAMSRYMDSYKAVFAAKQAMIDAADAIYLFHHWKESRGAMIEKLYAEYQGKRVIYCGEDGTTS